MMGGAQATIAEECDVQGWSRSYSGSLDRTQRGGTQIIIFPTGGGSPAESLISTVIKVTGNPRTAQLLKDHIDIDVSRIIKGESTLGEAGERVFREPLRVASGKKTQSERLVYGMISIWNIGPPM